MHLSETLVLCTAAICHGLCSTMSKTTAMEQVRVVSWGIAAVTVQKAIYELKKKKNLKNAPNYLKMEI